MGSHNGELARPHPAGAMDELPRPHPTGSGHPRLRSCRSHGRDPRAAARRIRAPQAATPPDRPRPKQIMARLALRSISLTTVYPLAIGAQARILGLCAPNLPQLPVLRRLQFRSILYNFDSDLILLCNGWKR
ncbi:hypothetical protein BRADI_2g27436v3 [Brachypodium distachyon]|uniref:Uncharacterized protein n=1 Tax=Brachypodium distachyon TaxID=15368 RepID=A0A0Q3QZQ7_BRADI|nr:hypothetical protein BRADI_2g27436v3 [Brachypodium distachyon]KQK06638.1 hypothetical protein BRADI_2g27436v3 [Brachypodium distachyon]KQK06641.1 hypothetical protein BRADI_2g27436v3 [Brachypodium distachyon]KQK06644.1 hypothetical protein BRADI_2g27436v3 [Brachypodium distachyon]KQK06645.1 hypothetical protein BRADI_2g27436v3 [Brachypodium distachyon]